MWLESADGIRYLHYSLSLSLSTRWEPQGGPTLKLPRERAPAVHRVSDSPPQFGSETARLKMESKNPPGACKGRDNAIKYNIQQASKAPTNIMKAARSPPPLRVDERVEGKACWVSPTGLHGIERKCLHPPNSDAEYRICA